MTCNQFVQTLHDYFLERLSVQNAREIDEHAACCAECGELMRVCRELSCRDFVAFLEDYLDGSLEPERREVFERHLTVCEDCRRYLASYRAMGEMSAIALAGETPARPAEPVPERLILAVLDALRRG